MRRPRRKCCVWRALWMRPLVPRPAQSYHRARHRRRGPRLACHPRLRRPSRRRPPGCHSRRHLSVAACSQWSCVTRSATDGATRRSVLAPSRLQTQGPLAQAREAPPPPRSTRPLCGTVAWPLHASVWSRDATLWVLRATRPSRTRHRGRCSLAALASRAPMARASPGRSLGTPLASSRGCASARTEIRARWCRRQPSRRCQARRRLTRRHKCRRTRRIQPCHRTQCLRLGLLRFPHHHPSHRVLSCHTDRRTRAWCRGSP